MATKRPYRISDTETILSQYATKLGKSVICRELRVVVGNWTSQTLMHNLPDVSGITAADLTSYAASRGVAGDVPALNRIADTIANSQPIQARYIRKYSSWQFGSDLAISVPSFTKFQTEIAGLYTDLHACTRFDAAYGAAYIPYICWAPDSFLVGAKASYESLFASDEWLSRNCDPHSNFMELLARCGFDLSFVKLEGTYCYQKDSMMYNIASGNYADFYRRDIAHDDTMYVTTPPDMFGCFRIYSYPRCGNNNLWCGAPSPPMSVDAQGVRPGYAYAGKGDLVGEVNVITAVNAVVDAYFTNIGKPVWGLILSAKEAYRPIYVEAYYAPTAADVSTLPSVFGDYMGPADIESINPAFNGNKLWWVKSKTWKIVRPNIFTAWKFGGVTFSVGDDGIDPYLVANMSVIGIQMPMSGLREFVQWQSGQPGVDAATKLQLQQFLARTEDKQDVLLKATVVADAIAPPSKTQLATLKFISKAKEADIDIWNEKLGEGNDSTLTTLANRLQKDKDNGKSYSVFVNSVENAVTQEMLVSDRVAASLDYASYWTITSSGNADAMYLTGVMGANAVETLTAYEAAVLLVNGAAWAAGSTDSSLNTILGPSWRSEFASLSKDDLRSVSNSVQSWQSPKPVGAFILQASAFCDSQGYPVVQYTDTDTLWRVCLLWKAGQGDPANMVAAAYFNNLLG